MFDNYLTKGQSAIEYLMTYGWMLLVVAVVGGAIFSMVQSESIESVSGFTGGDVAVDDFGTTSSGELQLVMRNTASDSVEINTINVTDGDRYTVWTGNQDVSVGDTDSVTLANVTEGDGANNLDVTVNYDLGGLSNMEVSGTVSGSFEITESGSSTGDEGVEPVSAPSVGGEWSRVEGDSYFGTDHGESDEFFVMTYEARDDSGNAMSEENGEPWTSISFNDAYDRCEALDSQTNDYDIHLVTNREWMTVARQIEAQSQNWADGNIGSSINDGGGLVRGWSANDGRGDDWENSDPAPDSTESNLYNVGADQGSSSGDELYRRTHVLGSGDVLWDFSGNVWQWVDVKEDGTALDDGKIYSGGSNDYLESSASFIDPWSFNDASDERYEIGSSNDNYGEEQGLGYVWSSTSSDRVLRRGGHWYTGPRAGPFASNSLTDASNTRSSTGFRCSAVPAA